MARVKPHQSHPLYYAHLAHRLSGVALTLFLPVHFLTLSLALQNRDGFEAFIAFADQPAVKAAEFGLIFLLAIHFFGGLRLLALEWLPWSPHQKFYAACALSGSFLVGGLFLLQVV